MRASSWTIKSSPMCSIGITLAAALCLLPLCVPAQQISGDIYRGGVAEPSAQLAGTTPTEQRYLYVVAGDVASPGVFHSSRSSVPAAELIERVGGTTSLFAPMLHRLRGPRVVERRAWTEAANWEIPAGDMLLVVGQRGVVDANRGADAHRFRHIVCLGLAPFPVLIPLAEGQATLNDLFDGLGQSRELMASTQVLPVRVYPGGQPSELDPGTLVMFPTQQINRRTIDERLLTSPIPIETVAPVAVPDQAEPPSLETLVPPPSVQELSTPLLLPSPQPAAGTESSPPVVPAISAPPTAFTVPPAENFSVDEGASAPQLQVRRSALTQAIPSTPDVTTAQAEQALPQRVSLTIDDSARTTATKEVGRRGRALAEVAVYTGILAIICLALAGAWSYWDRVRTTPLTFTSDLGDRDSMTPLAPQVGSDEMQALIDNQFPIIEENVELPPAQQYQGAATAQRRLRLDAAQPLAGPRAPFHAHPATHPPRSSEPTTERVVRRESDEADARVAQRLMAHLAAEKRVTRDSESSAMTANTVNETPRTRTEGSALEHALRRVMRKDRS